MPRVSIQPLFRTVPIRALESLTAHLFPATEARDYIEFHVALTSVVRGFESATKPRACDSINRATAGGSVEEKAYELGASHVGSGALPVTVQKNHFARVWQRVIP